MQWTYSREPKQGGTYAIVLDNGQMNIFQYTKSKQLMKKLGITELDGIWYRKTETGYYFFYNIKCWIKLPKLQNN